MQHWVRVRRVLHYSELILRQQRLQMYAGSPPDRQLSMQSVVLDVTMRRYAVYVVA